MKFVKVITIVVLSLSSLVAVACLGLLSAEDYMIREQAAYIVLNPLHLQFNGQIITCVEHINDGKPVKREGTYNFTVASQRRYWRMQEINNPKDDCCDYVDIYFD